MNRLHLAGRVLLGGVGIIGAAWLAPLPPAAWGQAAPQQLKPDDAALLKLNAGRRAFNEKNYALANNSFKEFLASNGGHHEAPGAWYGLGLCLLQGPTPDYLAAADAFQHASSSQEFSDRPLVLYYWGTALRGLGNQASLDAIAKPGEAEALHKTAIGRYEEAGRQFAAALAAFDQKIAAAPDAKPDSPDAEFAARACCDTAEMLLQTGKFKEAADASLRFPSDPLFSKTRYRALGLYHLGYAQFALRDYLSAGRSLSQLAPFQQDFGLHARYLLARIHHLSDERPEAAAQYKFVLDEFETRKKAAQQAMQNPAALDGERKAQYQSIAGGYVPDYVLRARFYGAVLQYEESHYAEAADTFFAIVQQQPKSAMAPEARLRLGFCYLSSSKFNEAIQMLDPLRQDKQFGDRASWYTARAQAALADPNNPDARQKALVASIDTLRRAADTANQMIATDPDARARRSDILVELGDTQQLAKQYREAAATYQQVLAEDAKSDRAEEAMQRKVTALHLAGQLRDSDEAGEQFLKAYPKSVLLPAVLFRQAENAYLTALAAADDKNPRPQAEQEKLFTDAAGRYQKLLAKYPEFDHADLAKQAIAICQARLGHFSEAIDVLLTIPESNRSGDLASVPYLLADCQIRTLPAEIDDALTAERLIDTADEATKLLENFIGANPKGPQAPDALLKLGYCYQRMASQMAVPDDRQKTLLKARDAYERSVQQFPNDPSAPTVIFERARCLALMNDPNGAQNELRRFQGDPLRSTPNAPLAMIRLSTLLRSQNQPQQAADVMQKCRNDYESALNNDPARIAWVPMMRYEHALGLQDLRKLPEARAILEDIVKQYPGKPDAVNATWRIAQCRRQEAEEKLVEARAVASRPGVNSNEVATAYAHAEEPLKQLSLATDVLRAQTEVQATKASNSEATLRMLYELAWCYRVNGNAETDLARMKLQQDVIDKVRSRWPKDQTSLAAVITGPEVPLAQVPMQPSEQKARECYQRLIFAGPASALASQARFELAELLSARGENDSALDLLATALENQPPRDLAQRIKVRVAAALLAKNNPQPALAQLQPILEDKDTTIAAEARYLAGEARIQQGDWTKAIETLLPFRDQDPYRNAVGLADRALVRLGYAFAQSNQWEPSRQTYEILLSRFPQSPWIDEARFGMGWGLQNQKRYDEAANAYTELTRRSAAEPAARAQLNIGVCRLEQKRPADALKVLLIVPLTYDYPEVSAAACYEAARAHLDSQQPQEAAKLLHRVVKDYPSTPWASQAQQRLAEIKG